MALEPIEPIDQDQLVFVNYTTIVAILADQYLTNEELAEGIFLILIGIIGMLLNALVLVLTFSCSHLRIMMNGFTIHGCLLDMFKVQAVARN